MADSVSASLRRWQDREYGIDMPFDMGVALGLYPGMSGYSKFGFNPEIGTATESIWSGGGLYDWFDSAETLSVVSDSTLDTLGGSGAQTVMIEGLDGDYGEITEIVVLSGTTPVTTTKTFLRVNRVRVIVAGTGDQNDGNLSLSGSSNLKLIAHISPGQSQTTQAVYTVPVGKTVLLKSGKAAIGKGKEAYVSFHIRTNGFPFFMGHSFYVYQGSYDYQFKIPLVVPEMSDLEVRAVTTTGTVDISAAFEMVVVDNL